MSVSVSVKSRQRGGSGPQGAVAPGGKIVIIIIIIIIMYFILKILIINRAF